MAETNKVGVGVFIVSEIGFFGVLLIAYIYFHLLPSSGPSAANSLSPLRTLGFSICLFLSSATIHMAGRSLRQGKINAVKRWLGLTVILGAAFLAGQSLEYHGLLLRGVQLSTNLFGATFFTLTGFHGLHVLVGLCVLGTLLGVAVSGHLEEIKPAGFEAATMYWHFVDGVWVVIFSVVYLWPLVGS
jgi:heme/copper-type cytochrome/quinol oxidase subunit 3